MAESVTIHDVVQGRPGSIRVDRRGPLQATRAGPPLVILGGMTQTLTSWSGQIRSLAAEREVVVYEARGQGRGALGLEDVSFARHVDDFVRLLEALELEGPVDLCGFSFGGRVALAIAAREPARIRRLVISGVSAGRGAVGRVIVRAWRAALATGTLETLAWLSLADTLGPAYLAKYEHMLEAMVRATVQRNSYEGIRALFEQTLDGGHGSPWSPLALAPEIRCPALLLAGEHDRLAPAEDLEQLAAACSGPARAEVLAGVGHTVAIEAAEAWRARVLEFLDAPEAGAR
ncbi:MAG: alpha/beta fold hydrolase [Myxococcales bacterium]|nr:alpha/beta fold hydrolase [Myxococcales bacterium]